MSYEGRWPLPFQELDRNRINDALKVILGRYPGARLGSGSDPDLEEFADDFAADESEDDPLEFPVGVPAQLVSDHGDEMEEAPDDDGLYWGMISVLPGDQDTPAYVEVSSQEAQNRSCFLTVGAIAGELSVALGGPQECEEM